MRINPTLPLLPLLLCILHLPVGAQVHSSLWGTNGELWNPDPANEDYTKLLDFTDVGYKQGNERIPDWPIGVNVKDFGATGDGETDDTQAIRDAIEACPPNQAVFFPKGRYTILDQIVIEKNYIVLRGEDMYESVLWFPKYLTELNTFDPEYLPKKLQAVSYDANGESYFGRSLYEEFPSHDKDGNPVKLKKPLTRIARGQHPKNSGFIQMKGGTHKSIENLAFELRDQPKGGHWEFVGADPIRFRGVSDGWIRNVYVRNADHAIAVSKAKHFSIINIFLDSYTLRGGGGSAIGHMGINISDSNHCLIHNVKTTGMWIHDMVSTGGMTKVVWSRISGTNLKLDHHSRGGKHDLYTEIDHGKGSRPFSSSKTETYWGLTSSRPIPYQEVRGQAKKPKLNVVVGMTTEDPSESGDGYFWETLDPNDLEPRNIYIAQMVKKGKPLPDYPFPKKPHLEGEPFTFFAQADAEVAQSGKPKSPYNRSLGLFAQSGTHNTSAYLKFDLQGAMFEQAEKAILRLYGEHPQLTKKGKVSTAKVLLRSVEDDSWEEHTINGSNAPASGDIIADVQIHPSSWAEFDITDVVNRELSKDGILSLHLTADDAAEYQKTGFKSSDGGNPPHLVITSAP